MVEATKATPTRDRSKQRRRFLFTALALLLALLVIEFSSFVILRLCATQADVYFSETALFDAHRNHRLNPDFCCASLKRMVALSLCGSMLDG